MNVENLIVAMRKIDTYIFENANLTSTDLQSKSLEMIKEELVGTGQCNINIGYSDEFRTKIFYLDLASEGKIYSYSRMMDKVVEVNKIPTLAPLELSGCQQIVLDFLRNNGSSPDLVRHIDALIIGAFKENVRYFLPLITAYKAEHKNNEDGFAKEIFKIAFNDAII